MFEVIDVLKQLAEVLDGVVMLIKHVAGSNDKGMADYRQQQMFDLTENEFVRQAKFELERLRLVLQQLNIGIKV